MKWARADVEMASRQQHDRKGTDFQSCRTRHELLPALAAEGHPGPWDTFSTAISACKSTDAWPRLQRRQPENSSSLHRRRNPRPKINPRRWDSNPKSNPGQLVANLSLIPTNQLDTRRKIATHQTHPRQSAPTKSPTRHTNTNARLKSRTFCDSARSPGVGQPRCPSAESANPHHRVILSP